jgi:hypothetical protein
MLFFGLIIGDLANLGSFLGQRSLFLDLTEGIIDDSVKIIGNMG